MKECFKKYFLIGSKYSQQTKLDQNEPNKKIGSNKTKTVQRMRLLAIISFYLSLEVYSNFSLCPILLYFYFLCTKAYYNTRFELQIIHTTFTIDSAFWTRVYQTFNEIQNFKHINYLVFYRTQVCC